MLQEAIIKKSVSPLTGKEYLIPESPEDKLGIDRFVAAHPGKKVVVVQGLGFVGSVMSLDVKKLTNGNGQLEQYSVDLTPFRKAIKSIGAHCRPDVLVLVETTVPPGTSGKIVKPLLEESLEKRGLPIDQLKVGHSYER